MELARIPVTWKGESLLRSAVTYVFAVKAELSGAGVSTADHSFEAVELSPSDQANRAAPRTGQDSNERVVAVAQRIRPF
jgi:hypothetical protein